MESLRILLVDENRHGLVARRAVLEELGYVVETASLAGEGLQKAEEKSFDVVVTDYRFADFGGPELIARLHERSPRTPAILLSGYVAALGLTEVSTGADIVLPKGPSEHKQLVHAIARLLRPRASSSKTSRGALSSRSTLAPRKRRMA
ncbi:MAG: response regulator [Acidobacteria bacterium]|nr:response regulator [Acidobacteriota bacterium]